MPLAIKNSHKLAQAPTEFAEAIGFRIPCYPYFLAGERNASLVFASRSNVTREERDDAFLRLFSLYTYHRSAGKDFVPYEELRQLPLDADEVVQIANAVMTVIRVAQEGEVEAAAADPKADESETTGTPTPN